MNNAGPRVEKRKPKTRGEDRHYVMETEERLSESQLSLKCVRHQRKMVNTTVTNAT